jgi:SAM-dependent methyltransferase
MISARLGLSAKSTVVELASNDGYLLQHFLPMHIPVLGIEPAANVAAVAIEKGVPCRVAFFGEALARELTAEGVQADLIIANNVLAQVPDLNDFVSGIATLLAPQGVVTLEFPHLIQLIDNNQFDTIYHEHFSYFSLAAIESLASRCRLRVIDVEELSTHGGSLRVYLTRATASWPVSDAVNTLRQRETAWGIKDMSSYAQFATNVERVKRDLLRLLIDAKDAGKTICGYGAPGKGNTLLNYCGIGRDLIDFTVDRNPYKHGRYTPGMHIPILPVEALEAARPDYILIVPWNLKSEIMSQMRHAGSWGAKFIVPIPDPIIIDPQELAP